MKRLLIKLSTRRCNGCGGSSFHTAHLTWIGRLRYVRRVPSNTARS